MIHGLPCAHTASKTEDGNIMAAFFFAKIKDWCRRRRAWRFRYMVTDDFAARGLEKVNSRWITLYAPSIANGDDAERTTENGDACKENPSNTYLYKALYDRSSLGA